MRVARRDAELSTDPVEPEVRKGDESDRQYVESYDDVATKHARELSEQCVKGPPIEGKARVEYLGRDRSKRVQEIRREDPGPDRAGLDVAEPEAIGEVEVESPVGEQHGSRDEYDDARPNDPVATTPKQNADHLLNSQQRCGQEDDGGTRRSHEEYFSTPTAMLAQLTFMAGSVLS